MVLNNLPQMFMFYFPSNFWYDEVVQKWTPMIERMRLPITTVNDFMNSQVQGVTFPQISLDNAIQQREQYEVAYAGGKEMEPLIDKSLTVTFKLTESYITYWILWDQIDMFLRYTSNPKQRMPIWMEPLKLTFLTDTGFRLSEFTFFEILPLGLSELNMSFAATVSSYNTFQLRFHYNRFEVE